MFLLYTFQIEKASTNNGCFNIMKWISFKNLTVETSQHWQNSSDQRHYFS